MGSLTPGVNWHVRQDKKYLRPTPIEEFRTNNREYIKDKIDKNIIDDHWKLMLDEIMTEVEMGRMKGPFAAPERWPVPSVAPGRQGFDKVLPLPHDDPFIAMAFSIEQTGSDGNTKIRRGEDWRRSGHKATCTMHGQPYHHTPDHFVSLGRAFLDDQRQMQLRVWGHDHDGACRQLPLHDPREAYVLVLTPMGPTLWSHNVLLFGSAASTTPDTGSPHLISSDDEKMAGKCNFLTGRLFGKVG
ncbi:unnamed protein product, partial [Symbiodinium sp. CCMP2456]